MSISENGGHDFSVSVAPFAFVTPVRVTNLLPTKGPVLGGTKVFIRSDNAFPHPAADGAASCRYLSLARAVACHRPTYYS